jgi:hypothetical protein
MGSAGISRRALFALISAFRRLLAERELSPDILVP